MYLLSDLQRLLHITDLSSDADFFLNNRFLESIQSFTFRIDLAINRNRNNRFLK
jgi:hypothetical protein